MKRIASAGLVAAALLLAPLGVAGTASAQTYYSSCKEAFAAGQSDIRIGEPGYRKGLDRDGDGVACERDEDGTGASGVASPISSESSPGSSDEESDSSSSDQVEVVPTGGAETGDGSTAGHHSGWWLGGEFLVGLAGLVTAHRIRPGAGSRV